MKVCYVSMFHNLGRENWNHFSRSFETYIEHFKPYIKMFDKNSNIDYEMIVLIDKELISRLKEEFEDGTRIKLIPIDEEYMLENFPMWKTIPIEREIMESLKYKKLVAHRSMCPETYIPEYTMINHCKIDAIAHVISSNLSSAEYFAWVDFGYFQGIESRIPKNFLDLKKLDLDKINYTLLNHITEEDRNITNTILCAPERVGGFFFFGNRKRMLEYQDVYHKVLKMFQETWKLADDDQHLAMICYFTKPELFKFHYTGKWHEALNYFS